MDELNIEQKVEEYYWAFYNTKLFEKVALNQIKGERSQARIDMCEQLTILVKEFAMQAYKHGHCDALEEIGVVRDDEEFEHDPLPDSKIIHPTDMRRSVGLSILNSMLTSGAANEVGTDILVGRSGCHGRCF